VLVLAAEEILERLDNGQQLRDDGFFDRKADGRSAADEIAKGVLRAAQDAYEERKLPYLASLISTMSFFKPLSREYQNYLIRLGADLSYRQLCLVVGPATPQTPLLAFSGAPIADALEQDVTLVLYVDRAGGSDTSFTMLEKTPEEGSTSWQHFAAGDPVFAAGAQPVGSMTLRNPALNTLTLIASIEPERYANHRDYSQHGCYGTH
jgi:hypothetical protein